MPILALNTFRKKVDGKIIIFYRERFLVYRFEIQFRSSEPFKSSVYRQGNLTNFKLFKKSDSKSFCRDGKPVPSVPEIQGAVPEQFAGMSKPTPFSAPDTNGPVSDYINRLSFIYGLSRPSMFNPYVKVCLSRL